jgi:prepilin-type processing-associated H-X9-DG protein
MSPGRPLQNYWNDAYPPILDQAGYFSYFSFGGPHSAGCNFAFCDGSVRSINYSIDLAVHACLGDRNDGQSIDANKL